MTDPGTTSSYFHADWWLALLGNLIGILFASSAFVVYFHTTQDLPVSVTFFWFSLFAFVTTLFLPRTITFNADIWRAFRPRESMKHWIDSLKKGGRGYILGSGIFYAGFFAFLLTSLHESQKGVVITVLVLFLLQPLLATLAGAYFLKDTFRAKWWTPGVFLTIFGVGLYRLAGSSTQPVFDKVFWLSVASVACGVSDTLLRRYYRREYEIKPVDAVLSVQLIAVVFGASWTLITTTGGFSVLLSPNMEEYLALLYLGVVPTAISITLMNHAEDVLGLPLSQAISNLRAPAAFVIEMVPLAWFYASHDHMGTQHYLGMGIAIVGVGLITFLAKSRPGKRKELTP